MSSFRYLLGDEFGRVVFRLRVEGVWLVGFIRAPVSVSLMWRLSSSA